MGTLVQAAVDTVLNYLLGDKEIFIVERKGPEFRRENAGAPDVLLLPIQRVVGRRKFPKFWIVDKIGFEIRGDRAALGLNVNLLYIWKSDINEARLELNVYQSQRFINGYSRCHQA